MIRVVIFVTAALVVMFWLKTRKPRTYRCRLGHCTRHFDTRDERALHFRRTHSMN